MELYYFSGTGNSLAVGRMLARQAGGMLAPIAAHTAENRIAPQAEAVGLIFPVYHGGLPLMMTRFLEKLTGLEGKYVFGLCTYGDSPGTAIGTLAGQVRARGGELAAGFAVHMPYNYITPGSSMRNFFGSFKLREIPAEKQAALFKAAGEKMAEVSAFVRTRKRGIFEVEGEWISRIVEGLKLEESLGKSVWLKIAGVTEKTDLSFLESRQLMDRAFWTDDCCKGCGICARVCPAENIRLQAGRPAWLGRCEQCFACLQWCPQKALQFGANTPGGPRYHHPEVKPADLYRR